MMGGASLTNEYPRYAEWIVSVSQFDNVFFGFFVLALIVAIWARWAWQSPRTRETFSLLLASLWIAGLLFAVAGALQQ